MRDILMLKYCQKNEQTDETIISLPILIFLIVEAYTVPKVGIFLHDDVYVL